MALQFVIPTIINNSYNYNKFKITEITNKGLGVVATEDLVLEDINKVLVHGGILFNDKQYKKYMKLNNDLKFENNDCNSNIFHITKANVLNEPDFYLIANPILYNNNNYKNGWIGSFVNEVSVNESNKTYNAELIVLSEDDIINYQHQINQLPDCIDKSHK